MEAIIKGHKEEVSSYGMKCLASPQDVESFLKLGTCFIYVHSLCGCAGMRALPVVQELSGRRIMPKNSGFVFAGQDIDATLKAREYFLPNQPSSPAFIVLKDMKPILFISREDIQSMSTDEMIKLIVDATS
jgi:putative YphP/YqiW family bacilliredoxin